MYQEMVRPHYRHQQDTKIFRRTHQGGAGLNSQSMREDSQDISDSSGARRLTIESEGKPSGHNQRRRTQVACSRCRKRKIKCSGDLGNGQACSNCKNAGAVNCMFLRVNSAPVANPSYGPWPYPLLGSNSSPTAGQQQAAYHSHITRTNSMSMHAPSSVSPTYSMVQSGFEYVPSAEPSNHRTSYAVGYPVSYDEDTAYGLQFPSYMLPNGPVTGANNFSAATTPAGGWRTANRIDSPNGAVNSSPDGNSSLSTSSFPCMARQSSIPTPVDATALFPAMNSLSSGSDRTLPDPTTSRYNLLPTFASPTESTSSANSAMGSVSTPAYKQTCQWGVENDISSDAPCPRTSSSASTCSNPSSNVNAIPSTSSADFAFGYIPISNSPPSNISSAPFAVTEVVDAADGFQTSADSRFRRYLPKDNYPSNPYPTGGYRHSTECDSRRPVSNNWDGMLVSGRPYDRPVLGRVESSNFHTVQGGSASANTAQVPFVNDPDCLYTR